MSTLTYNQALAVTCAKWDAAIRVRVAAEDVGCQAHLLSAACVSLDVAHEARDEHAIRYYTARVVQLVEEMRGLLNEWPLTPNTPA